MTPMSELRPRAPRKHLVSRAHGACMIVAASVLAGCILPPSLAVDNQDAGIDSPPAITSVQSDSQDLEEPGPVDFVVAPFASSQTLDLTLIDTDVNDTLSVRVFVNYSVDSPTPPRATCTGAPSTPPEERKARCDISALCLQSEIGRTDLLMEVVVFDRPVLDSGSPAFKATKGGLSTDRTYQLRCLAPST